MNAPPVVAHTLATDGQSDPEPAAERHATQPCPLRASPQGIAPTTYRAKLYMQDMLDDRPDVGCEPCGHQHFHAGQLARPHVPADVICPSPGVTQHSDAKLCA